jgi:hypothetical protein
MGMVLSENNKRIELKPTGTPSATFWMDRLLSIYVKKYKEMKDSLQPSIMESEEENVS